MPHATNKQDVRNRTGEGTKCLSQKYLCGMLKTSKKRWGGGGTKYIHFQPLSHPNSAKLFIAEVVRLHGLPKSIVTKRTDLFSASFGQNCSSKQA